MIFNRLVIWKILPIRQINENVFIGNCLQFGYLQILPEKSEPDLLI
jgi:hypothetical protein